MTKDSPKSCFVIGPIGKEDSEERRRSDQVLKHLIAPAAKECGYDPQRADQISEPGIITSQIIQHLVDDNLVIADLTGHNPNVFYELAIRHAVGKPVVQMISRGETIPFDVSASRTIQVDHHDLDSVAAAKVEMIKQIKAVERNPGDVDTPLLTAVRLQALQSSDNPLEKSSAEIIAMLQDLRGRLDNMGDRAPGPPLDPQLVQALGFWVGNLLEFVHTMVTGPGLLHDYAQGLRSRADDVYRVVYTIGRQAKMRPETLQRLQDQAESLR